MEFPVFAFLYFFSLSSITLSEPVVLETNSSCSSLFCSEKVWSKPYTTSTTEIHSKKKMRTRQRFCYEAVSFHLISNQLQTKLVSYLPTNQKRRKLQRKFWVVGGLERNDNLILGVHSYNSSKQHVYVYQLK